MPVNAWSGEDSPSRPIPLASDRRQPIQEPQEAQAAEVARAPSEEEMEALIRSIGGVQGCRVVRDRRGGVSEVHVVSAGARPPKMLVRDIQSLLLVRFGVSIPYQKVSVVALRPSAGSRTPRAGDESPAGLTGAEGEEPRPTSILPQGRGDFGWRLAGLELWVDGGVLRVRVRLEHPDGRSATGESAGPYSAEESAALGARAVVDAVSLSQDPPMGAGVSLQWVDFAGPAISRSVVVAVARAGDGASPPGRSASASHPAEGNVTLAGALAALEALAKLPRDDEGAV